MSDLKLCAIDPGAGGGIAFYVDESKVLAVPMPATNKDFWEYVNYLKTTYGPFMVFIERVGVWRGDNDSPGKQYGIAKMLANYNSLIAILEANDLPVVEIAAISWQKELMLYEPKKSKTERKNLYKRYAAKQYPMLKPNLKTSDAICILHFARIRCVTSAKWVLERVRNPKAANIFTHG